MKPLNLSEPLNAKAVQLLRRFGFSGYEAAVWLELVNGFPATAYQIAKRAGLQRANVYRAIERLLEIEAVSIVHAKPAAYSPVDPKSLVARLTTGLADECERFADGLSRRMQSRNQGSIRTAAGVDACLNQLHDELGTAQLYVWLKGEAGTLRLLLPSLEAACLRGVQIKIIAFGAWRALQKKLPSAMVYPHEGKAQRLTSATDALLTLARDGRAVTTAVFSEAATVTCVQDHALTYQLHSYLLHEIFLAELVANSEDGARITRDLKRLREQHRPEGMERALTHI